MTEKNSVVAVYDTHEKAEDAVKELQRSGIDMRTLSIIGKGTHTDEQVVGYYNNGDRMKFWGKAGEVLEGAVVVGGVSAIGAGLYGMGIPKDSVLNYETALKTDKCVLLVNGTARELEKAREIIDNTRPDNVTMHVAELAGAAR